MASTADHRRTFLGGCLAVALSAAGFFLGTGLTPVAWLTWLAPLPVLLLAPRVSARTAATVAFVAWLVGELNLWTYLTDQIEMPGAAGRRDTGGVRRAVRGVRAVVRGLVRRGRPFAAALALPVLWVSAEYFFSVFSPDGALVPGTAWAVAICKDLDFPALARDYRRAGAGLLLVPAWDFDRDAWLHSRMAVLRGVENGLPIARSARSGALTISDPYGRIVAEGHTGSVTANIVTAGVGTPYTRLGPWFAWLCLALAAGAIGRTYRGSHEARSGQRPNGLRASERTHRTHRTAGLPGARPPEQE